MSKKADNWSLCLGKYDFILCKNTQVMTILLYSLGWIKHEFSLKYKEIWCEVPWTQFSCHLWFSKESTKMQHELNLSVHLHLHPPDDVPWGAWSTSARHCVNSPPSALSTRVAPDHLSYMILQDNTGAFLSSSARESSLLCMVDLFLAILLPVSWTSSAVKSSRELRQVIPLSHIAIAEQFPFEFLLHDKNPFWFYQGRSSRWLQTSCLRLRKWCTVVAMRHVHSSVGW